ncbi:MAG: hypothetical protein V1859_05525 [archaeon]
MNDNNTPLTNSCGISYPNLTDMQKIILYELQQGPPRGTLYLHKITNLPVSQCVAELAQLCKYKLVSREFVRTNVQYTLTQQGLSICIPVTAIEHPIAPEQTVELCDKLDEDNSITDSDALTNLDVDILDVLYKAMYPLSAYGITPKCKSLHSQAEVEVSLKNMLAKKYIERRYAGRGTARYLLTKQGIRTYTLATN